MPIVYVETPTKESPEKIKETYCNKPEKQAKPQGYPFFFHQ